MATESRSWSMRIAAGDPIDHVNPLTFINQIGFTELIEPQKRVRSILIRSGDMISPARESSGAPLRALLIRAAVILFCQGTVMAEPQETKDNALIWVTIGTLVVGVVVILILNSIIGV